MDDLSIVWADLHAQYSAWSTAKIPLEDVEFSLSPGAVESWQRFLEVERPSVERHLDDFVVGKLGIDIAPDVHRALVMRAICPETGILISRQMDVSTDLGLAKYRERLENPTEVFHERYNPHCPTCCYENGDLQQHPARYTFTRFASQSSLDSWDAIDKKGEQIAKLNMELRARRNMIEGEDVGERVSSLSSFSGAELSRFLIAHYRSEDRMYAEMQELVALAGMPLTTAMCRVKSNLLRKMVKCVVHNYAPNDAFGIRALVNTGDFREVEYYAYSLFRELDEDEDVKIEQAPFVAKSRVPGRFKAMKGLLRYGGVNGVRLNVHVLSLAGYRHEQQNHVTYKIEEENAIDALRETHPIAALERAILAATPQSYRA